MVVYPCLNKAIYLSNINKQSNITFGIMYASRLTNNNFRLKKKKKSFDPEQNHYWSEKYHMRDRHMNAFLQFVSWLWFLRTRALVFLWNNFAKVIFDFANKSLMNWSNYYRYLNKLLELNVSNGSDWHDTTHLNVARHDTGTVLDGYGTA